MTDAEAAAYVRRWRVPSWERPAEAVPRKPLPLWTDDLAAWWARHTGETLDRERLRDELTDLQRVILDVAPPEPAPSPPPPVTAERLSGGHLNDVFRVRIPRQGIGDERFVLKHARSSIADLPLDPARIGLEAAVIRLLTTRMHRRHDGTRVEGPGSRLHGASATVGPAWVQHYDDAQHLLILRDLGDLPDLGAWLYGQEPPHSASVSRSVHRPRVHRARQRGMRLGRYIGALHRRWHEDADLAARFDNASVQQTRLLLQYRAIGGLLEAAGVPDAGALGTAAVALGERLLGPGRCLLHGDLWPRSVLCGPAYTRLIDWEFAHFGQPGQDTGHLAAHLWMLRHRAPTPDARAAVAACADGFAAGYAALAPAALRTPACLRDAALHAGCEVLVRTVGAFRDGYLYDDLSRDGVPAQQAVAHAAAWMRAALGTEAEGPTLTALFDTEAPALESPR